jgi:hypothetical protein
LTGGCGRKATVADCERIVERIAELHLAGVVPAEELPDRVRETRRELHDQTLSHCVGKRIPKDALECLTKAASAELAVAECFD